MHERAIFAMNAARWEQLQQIVWTALDMDAADRSGWMAAQCHADHALEQQAQEMLAAFDDERLDGLERAMADEIASAAEHIRLATEVESGDQIGVYRVLRRLASGGMGSVFLAERRDNLFQQRVAIKVAHSSVRVSESLLNRFRLERQVLAEVRHPNIASLLDGGLTAGNLPYLVMEYIDGENLLDFVQERRFSERQTLALFSTVCAAVQHAHGHMVIHRDLKPANVLVTPDGQPKLLDFGIAKILSDASSPALAAETMAIDRLMTLQYASPEQVNGGVVTTATDVYGLGAMLYELLTGRPVFVMGEASLADVQRMICTTAPVPPSLCLQSQSRARHTHQTDLDRIVLKALHKQPERRYRTVNELSDDLDRYLHGFPVRAHADSTAYRLTRYVQRHTVFVGLATLSISALLMLLALLTVQTRRARLEAASADAVTNYLIGLFDQNQPDKTHGRTLSTRDLLDHGTVQLDSSWKGDPLIRARLLGALGTIYSGLGDLEKAQGLLERAERVFASAHVEESMWEANTAAALGDILAQRGDAVGALQQYHQALAVMTDLRGRRSFEASKVISHLGELENRTGDFDQSARTLEESVEINTALFGSDALATLEAKHSLEFAYMSIGDYRQAEILIRSILKAYERTGNEDTTLSTSATGNLAAVLDREGRVRESYPLLVHSLSAHEKLFGKGHPRTILPMMHLGWYWCEMGRLDEARRLTEQSLRISRATEGEAASRTTYAEDTLGLILLKQGDIAAARRYFQHSLDMRESRPMPSRPLLSQNIDHLGMADLADGNASGARERFKSGLDMLKSSLSRESDWFAISYLHLGQANLALGLLPEASHNLDEAQRILHAGVGDADHPLVAETLFWQAAVDVRRGLMDDARARLTKALTMQRRVYGTDDQPDVKATIAALAALPAR